MELTELKQFLVDANGAGYAGGEEKKWIKEHDGSTRIPYVKGDFRSDDHFYGGEPYGGMMVVFYKDQAVWMMTYYGWVEEGVPVDRVYEVLRGALKEMPKDYPYRGPKEYHFGDYKYVNSWEGELERYSGEEEIRLNNKTIYKAYYRGGIVDVRRGV